MDDLRDQIALLLKPWETKPHGDVRLNADRIAAKVMTEVVTPELERLRTERDEAREAYAEVVAAAALRGTAVTLERRAVRAEAERDEARADHAGAERRLKVAQRNIEIKNQAITEYFAAIERAKELARHPRTSQGRVKDYVDAADVLAALDTPTPTEETGRG